MDKFREQSVRFGTNVITETISKIDLSKRPFRYWREGKEEGEAETADTVILATGACARRLGLKGEDTYWQSGISACAVCDGAVPIFRNKPLAVIGGGDSAAEEATCELTRLFIYSLNNTQLEHPRPHQVRITRLCSRPKRRTPSLEDHGQASPQSPQSGQTFRSPTTPSVHRSLTFNPDRPMEHRSDRMSR